MASLLYSNEKEKAIVKACFNNSLFYFTTYFFNVLKGEKFLVNWHHYYLCQILEDIYYQRRKNVIINISPGSSKCQCAGDKVFTTRGWVPVETVEVGDVLYSFDKGKIFTQKVVATESFEKECVEVETKLHNKIKTSFDHPVLTQNGWKHASDLTEKDFTMQLCSAIDGTERIPDAELDLMTLLLFEGGTSQQSTKFTSADQEVIDVFYKAVETLGMSVSKAERYTYRIKQGYTGIMNTLRKKYGIDRCLAIHKRLPLQFFNLPIDQKYRFIGLMIATDGFVARNKGGLGICLGSQELAHDIKLFLMTCGINSLYREYKNGFAGAHGVWINGSEASKLFGKINCLQKQTDFTNIFNKPRFNLSYGYPLEVQKGLTYQMGKLVPRISAKSKNGFISEHAFTRICNELDSSREHYRMNDFIYDRVLSVKKIGIQRVYHLQVESNNYDLQNYISNGLVAHNSVIVSKMFPAWCLAKNPHSRFILASYSDDLVEGHSSDIKEVISSFEFSDLYPGYSFKQDNNKKKEWQLEYFGKPVGELLAASIFGKITGKRAGFMEPGFTGAIILDDVLKPDDATSEAKRTRANDVIYNTIRSRKANPNVPIVMIMQRLHEDDPTGFLINNCPFDNWELIKIPAEIDKEYFNTLPPSIQEKAVELKEALKENEVVSYWPYKEPIEELNKIKDGSSYVYQAQYLQNPTPKGGTLIQNRWFRSYEELPQKFKNIKIIADTAIGVKNHNDYSVFMLTGEFQGNVYLIDLLRGRWEAPQLIQMAKDFCYSSIKRFPSTLCSGVYIEFKASGQGLIQTLRQETKLPIIDINPKGDKVTRLNQVIPYIESGRVFLPDKSPWIGTFLDECASFSPVMAHKHDDQVDCLVYALWQTYITVKDATIRDIYF